MIKLVAVFLFCLAGVLYFLDLGEEFFIGLIGVIVGLLVIADSINRSKSNRLQQNSSNQHYFFVVIQDYGYLLFGILTLTGALRMVISSLR